MKKTNALKLRQNLGAVLKLLNKDGQPILVEKNAKPAAVLITLEDFQKRFVDFEADEKRKEIINKIKESSLKGSEDETSLDILRKIRGE